MPTYDYECDACEHQFELFQGINDPVETVCPQCKKPKLRRLFGTGAAIVFKGSGFYQTDYRSESYRKGAASEKKSSSDSSSKSDSSSSGGSGSSASSEGSGGGSSDGSGGGNKTKPSSSGDTSAKPKDKPKKPKSSSD
jgi:putative FmdB family regulatory protein